MAFIVNIRVLIGVFLTVSLFIGVQGHSYVTSPQSRSNQQQTLTGCRGPNCLGPCEIPLSRRSSSAAVHVASRGDQITVQWPRNNHAGGFIRFAWAPTYQSDNASYFDQHVQLISCHETGGCYPDDPANPNGGDSGPADGSSRACSQTFSVPADLTDGLWTLQWAWFGGAFSLGDYYSCVDYSISGGASGSTPIPVFKGGDYTYPGQSKCKFFNTDRLHVCVNEPCSNPIYPAAQQQSGAPAYVQYNFALVNSTTPSPAPSTPAVPSTTGVAASKPSTPATTAATAVPTSTSTGAAPVPSPTPVPTPITTPPSSSSCVSGYMKCVGESTYSTCNHGVWGASQSCTQGLSCSPSGDYIYCLTPSASTSSSSSKTPAPAASTSSSTSSTSSSTSTSTSASSTSYSPIASGDCTLGYQQCVGSNSYQTCGNGRNGPAWAGVQYCQTGLSCHASATANNIYCY